MVSAIAPAGGGRAARRLALAAGGSTALILAAVLLIAIMAIGLLGGPPVITPDTAAGCADAECGMAGWDPGNIISDQIFFNSTAMNEEQVRQFISTRGAACQSVYCLRNIDATAPEVAADRYCQAIPGAADQDAAAVIVALSVACGVNPQVMLVTLQKESQLLTRTDPSLDSYTAAWGWNCPDTGSGGTANCDPSSAGFVNQAIGIARQWARYRVDPGKYTYQAGQTIDIPYNVPDSGCGGASVTIANTATAALYDYTPYQPNPAALAAYPGQGDRCSTYGNRNFFYLFQTYFGSTGGGTQRSSPPSARGGTTGEIQVVGASVTLPTGPDVNPGAAGKTINAPTPDVARGIAAGLATVGMPYVWGGGTSGGGPDQGCQRGGGALNSCAGIVGLDCSGLTAYVLTQAGFHIPTNSGGQRTAGINVAREDAQPGDIIGYSGHVALYLGRIDGIEYTLEAPQPGENIHVRTARWSKGRTPADTYLHRYWS